MTAVVRFLLLTLFYLPFLIACGGGGGGGSTPSSVSISLDKTTLNFSAARNGTLPATQQVIATFQGEGVLVTGYPDEITPPAWLSVDYAAPPTNTTTTFNVSISTTNLVAGTHTATVRFLTGSTAAQQSTTVDLVINFSVDDVLAVSQSTYQYSAVLAQPVTLQQGTLDISANTSTNWTATDDAGWLQLSQASGTGAASVAFALDSNGLAVGLHTALITLTDTGTNDVVTVTVNLNIQPPSFSMSSGQLTVNGINGKYIAPHLLYVNMSNDVVANWTVTASDAWLVPSLGSGISGGVDTELQIAIDAQTPVLASGQYNGSLTFTANILGQVVTEVVPVSLNLTPMTFSQLPPTVDVSGINGSRLTTSSIDFALDTDSYNQNWTVSSTANWLLVDGAASNTGVNSGTVVLTVDASSLSSGSYTDIVTFSAQVNGDTIVETLDFNLVLTQATLSLTQSEITFAGVNGTDLGAYSLDFSINTGAETHPWILTMDSGLGLSWMKSNIAAGQASNTLSTAVLSADLTGLAGNVYPGTATVSVQVNGDTLTSQIPVSLRLDPAKLFVADNGVLLTSSPSYSSQLSHAVTVYDNGDLNNILWTTASDQAWLSVTASGTSSGSMTLTANPVGLSQDTLHLATVTLSSADTLIENSASETVTVGFYNSSTDPAVSTSVILNDPAKQTGMVSDPVRPYVYITHGGTDIEIYNVFTGTLETTLAGVGGDLRYLTVSSDGASLYAVDHSDSSILPVDLSTRVAQTKFTGIGFPTCISCATQNLLVSANYTRINGYPVLITSAEEILDAANGTVLASLSNPSGLSFNYLNSPYIEVSANGRAAYSLGLGTSPFSLARYELSYSSLEAGTFTGEMTHTRTGAGGNAKDLAITETGSHVYISTGSGCGTYELCVYDGSNINWLNNLAGEAFPGAVEIAANGDIFSGYNTLGIIDIRVFDKVTQTQTATFPTSQGLEDRQLIISGDSSVVVARSQQPAGSDYLDFIRVSP